MIDYILCNLAASEWRKEKLIYVWLDEALTRDVNLHFQKLSIEWVEC